MLFSTLLSLFVLLPSTSALPFSGAAVHDHHVTRCLAHYRSSEQALQISLQFFIDDMEKALEDQGGSKLFLGTSKEVEEAQGLLLDYLGEHLQFEIDGTIMQPEWIGRETTEDLSSIWCYMEIQNLAKPQKLVVTNKLLLEVYEDQKNLFSFNFDNHGEVYYIFINGKDTETIRIP